MAKLSTKVIALCLLLSLTEFPCPSSSWLFRRPYNLKQDGKTGWYTWSCRGGSATQGYSPDRASARGNAREACRKRRYVLGKATKKAKTPNNSLQE
ncbi:Hypothetical predicted protein [Paramuricea clavata]|uniref:Uncharacterized protein n=1 Tax=Paramuricea clavata TaxID=317549 RepID=A0A7D9E9T2_PARCT|nr:Hypothetical predicted protein [Paramuricea clavata]